MAASRFASGIKVLRGVVVVNTVVVTVIVIIVDVVAVFDTVVVAVSVIVEPPQDAVNNAMIRNMQIKKQENITVILVFIH